MKRLRWLLLFAAAVAVGHGAMLYFIPRQLMANAMTAMGRGGERVNVWIGGARVGPESRRVVRPSPDLAYSACIYDLRDGPIRVRVAPWRHYWSVSVFADDSDNIATRNDLDDPAGSDFLLAYAGATVPATAPPVVVASSARGVLLIRRLLLPGDDWARIEALRARDTCARWTP